MVLNDSSALFMLGLLGSSVVVPLDTGGGPEFNVADNSIWLALV